MPKTRRPLLALVALLMVVGVGYALQAAARRSSDSPTQTRSMRAVDASTLPAQARDTLRLVRAGGPFPYSSDGVDFRNAEHLLPAHSSGYYHEYTVPTPGESDRGARRIITGNGGEIYYTGDHYRSFVRVRGP